MRIDKDLSTPVKNNGEFTLTSMLCLGCMCNYCATNYKACLSLREAIGKFYCSNEIVLEPNSSFLQRLKVTLEVELYLIQLGNIIELLFHGWSLHCSMMHI